MWPKWLNVAASFIICFLCLLGAGESPPRQELAREISNAMASMDSNFEHDLLFSTDSLNVDPLDLEHLQMLSDNDIVADQATEDSFRQDHRL